MAFNNGFPMNYNGMNYYQNPIQQQIQAAQNSVQQAQQQLASMHQTNNAAPIWVQGEAGAKSYLVAPNNVVDLWDTEGSFFYRKSADASGMPSIKKYFYKEIEMGTTDQKQNNIDLSNYVKKDELEPLLASFLTKKINERKNQAEVTE